MPPLPEGNPPPPQTTTTFTPTRRGPSGEGKLQRVKWHPPKPEPVTPSSEHWQSAVPHCAEWRVRRHGTRMNAQEGGGSRGGGGKGGTSGKGASGWRRLARPEPVVQERGAYISGRPRRRPGGSGEEEEE